MNATGSGVAVVTGVTGGMGRVIASELAARGMRVLGVAREPGRGGTDGASGVGSLQMIGADLSTRAGIRSAAEAIAAETTSVHVLVNNAGAHFSRHRRTPDGLEAHIAVDYLAATGLTLHLEEQLRRGGARVVNVASDSLRDTRRVPVLGRPRPVRVDRADLQDLARLNPAAGFVPFEAYARAKLLTVVAGYALARSFEPDGVTVNAVHPGIVATDLIADVVPRALRLFEGLITRTMLTPEEGAAAALRVATHRSLDSVTGRYFSRDREVRTPPVSYDLDLQRELLVTTRRFLEGRPA